MEENRLDLLIKESLNEEIKNIGMSEGLRNNIKSRIQRRSFYERFRKAMNTTIEIPIPSFFAACILIACFTFVPFIVTQGEKDDKSISGYSNIKLIKVGPSDIYMDVEDGGINSEKNKD